MKHLDQEHGEEQEPEVIPKLNEKDAWEACAVNTQEWLTKGSEYAKYLKELGHLDLSIDVYKRLYMAFPNNLKLKRDYSWALYRCFKNDYISNGETDISLSEMHRTIDKIMSLITHSDKYSPYTMTALSTAEFYKKMVEKCGSSNGCLQESVVIFDYSGQIQQHNTPIESNEDNLARVSLVREWLVKINRRELRNDYFTYDRTIVTKSRDYEEVQYWSQERKYLELKAWYLWVTGSVDKAIYTYLSLLKKCKSSATQVTMIKGSLGKCVLKLVSSNPSGFGHEPYNHIGDILEWRGFSEKFETEYRTALLKKFGWSEAFNYANTYDQEFDNKMRTQAAERALLHLQDEVISFYKTKKRPQQSSIITASGLANYAFCPASYSIQESFDLEPLQIANIGTMLHEKQLLIINKKKEDEDSFYQFAKTGDYKSVESVFPDEVKESIAPLLEDIATSKLILSGHNTDKPELFFDDEKTIVGSPDYVFEREDGSRFVIEEKFTCHKNNTKPITSPYINHKVQLGVYISQLSTLKADSGYILYWKYSLDDDGHPCVGNASSFYFPPNTDFMHYVDSFLSDLKHLRENGEQGFDIRGLNQWKCVNCATSDICAHKTGMKEKLCFPYESFEPKTL